MVWLNLSPITVGRRGGGSRHPVLHPSSRLVQVQMFRDDGYVTLFFVFLFFHQRFSY